MTDLAKLTTAALLEDLGKLRRYRAQLERDSGPTAYAARLEALVAELRRRGVPLTADALPPPRPPCRLRPLSDHVVVLPASAETMTEGGLFIPDSAKEVPAQGEVLAVGPGRLEPGVGTVVPTVQVGDTVLFGRYSGVRVTLDELEVLIMREEDVLGVLAPRDVLP